MENRVTSPQRLEYQRVLRQRLKQQGLCSYCRCTLKGDDKKYVRCFTCRRKTAKQQLAKIASRRKLGLCRCGKPVVFRDKAGVCEDCWFKAMANTASGSPKNWLLIKDLLQRQKYRCIYTGKELVMGGNASLDHIVPKSRGGDNCIENLQWVDLQINRMKNNMSHQEFVSTITLIFSVLKPFI